MRDYETIARSIVSCWRIVSGDFNYESLAYVNWYGAFAFILLFTFLVVNILLNMLLAIVIETYLAVKREQSSKSETLYSQAMETLGRFINKRRGKRLGLEVIYTRLLQDSKRRMLSQGVTTERSALMQKFFRLCEEPCELCRWSQDDSTEDT